jgi:hypothetical protein
VNVATTKAGINMDAVADMGRIIKACAERTKDKGAFGCAKLVVFSMCPRITVYGRRLPWLWEPDVSSMWGSAVPVWLPMRSGA